MQTERTATLEDVEFIAQNLRETDRKECEIGGDDAEAVLKESFGLSVECYVMCKDDDPFCIYGVSPDGEKGGIIWLMATDSIRNNSLFFLRTAKKNLQELLEFYGRLFNVVWEGNELHMKWLKYMGFEFGPTVKYQNENFRSFELCVQSQP